MLTTTHRGRFGRHDDLALRAKPGESLTLEQMRASLPAIFADHAHESRSTRYVHISTEDMLTELVAKDFLPVEARVSRSRVEGKQDFTKHMIRFRAKPDIATAFYETKRQVGDVSFEVLLRNAHDGTSSYQFMAGLLKLLCLNGLVVSDGEIENVKVLHTGNRQRQLNQVVEGAFTVLDQGPRVIDTVRRWRGVDLTGDDRMAFAEAARIVRFGDAEGKVETPIQAGQLLEARRYEERGKTDLWSTFNVIQENAIRGGLTAMGRDANNRPRRSTSREVKAIDGDVKINKALWLLAERLAEHKGAAA